MCPCSTISSGTCCTLSTLSPLPSFLLIIICSSSLLASSHCLIISSSSTHSVASNLLQLVFQLRTDQTLTHVSTDLLKDIATGAFLCLSHLQRTFPVDANPGVRQRDRDSGLELRASDAAFQVAPPPAASVSIGSLASILVPSIALITSFSTRLPSSNTSVSLPPSALLLPGSSPPLNLGKVFLASLVHAVRESLSTRKRNLVLWS